MQQNRCGVSILLFNSTGVVTGNVAKPGDCALVGNNLRKSVVFLMIWTLVPAVIACRGPAGAMGGKSAVLSSGDMIITRSAFEDHLELKMAAYPMEIRKKPDEFNRMVMALVNELTEELILVRAAREKGIGISENEYAEAEKKMKEDYPGDSFEKMLLENAVDYPFWKRRFKRRLLIDKLIRQALLEKIEITSGEVVSYYNRLQTDTPKREEAKKQDRMSEEKLVAWIRRHKAQKRYDGWLRDLSEKFPVKVNDEQLKSILKSAPKGKRIE